MRQSGLTLIELLVAIVLLSLLSLMAYRGLGAMMHAEEHVVGVAERWQSISLFFERFGADVAQPSARPVRDAAGAVLPQWWGRQLAEPGDADAQLEFTRKSPPGQPDVRLAYRLRGSTLELLIWPVLDRSPASRAQAHPLLDNVSGMRLRYLDAQGHWQEEWPLTGDREPLPRAVAIELSIADQPPVQRIFALP